MGGAHALLCTHGGEVGTQGSPTELCKDPEGLGGSTWAQLFLYSGCPHDYILGRPFAL